MGKATRGKGEGSIFQLASGYWCGSVEAGRYPTGGRRKARVVRKRKDDVIAEMARLREASARGLPLDRRSLAAYLEFWLDDVIAHDVSDGTLTEYRNRLARVTPVIGDVRLTKLTKTHVQQLAARLSATHSPRTRSATLTTLRQALRWAVPDLIPHNPAEGVRAKRTPKGDIDDALTGPQAAAVLAAVAGTDAEALIWLALKYGLRIGELRGLRWSDIGDDEMTVRRSTTKTDAGARTIPLLPEAKTVIATHRRRSEIRALDGSVFVSARGRAISPDAATKWWNDALTTAKVPHLCRACGTDETCSTSVRRFHAARHTTATLLLEAGVPLEVVSAILGHSNIAITADIYARVRSDLKRKGLDRLG